MSRCQLLAVARMVRSSPLVSPIPFPSAGEAPTVEQASRSSVRRVVVQDFGRAMSNFLASSLVPGSHEVQRVPPGPEFASAMSSLRPDVLVVCAAGDRAATARDDIAALRAARPDALVIAVNDCSATPSTSNSVLGSDCCVDAARSGRPAALEVLQLILGGAPTGAVQ